MLHRYSDISIRAPARGATSCKRVSHADRHISIRAPARGATESFDKVMAHNKFQSALPRGERPFAASFIALFIADFNPRSREGSDLWYDVHRPGERHFNPRSREGSDCSDCIYDEFIPISIRAPARGATINLLLIVLFLQFQSALPRGERHILDCNTNALRNFNPRSREGSDHKYKLLTAVIVISIRAPARGATAYGFYRSCDYTISIRAPARGATCHNRYDAKHRAISIRAPARGVMLYK